MIADLEIKETIPPTLDTNICMVNRLSSSPCILHCIVLRLFQLEKNGLKLKVVLNLRVICTENVSGVAN